MPHTSGVVTPNLVHRLPAPLENAVQRLKMAARAATERTIESLGLAALASHSVYQRDNLLGAQFELNRKSAIFVLTFNEEFDQRVMREVGAQVTEPGHTSWDALSLVDDHEMELKVAAERFGLEIAHACEWELRELGAYITSLLAAQRSDAKDMANPLRPEVVGHAMMRAVEAMSERADVRKVLTGELARSLGELLRSAYSEIVADLRQAGVQPTGLSVRHVEGRGGGGGGGSGGDAQDTGNGSELGAHSAPGGFSHSRHGGPPRGSHGSFDLSTRSGASGRGSIGQVDPAVMSLIRRLVFTDANSAFGDVNSDWDDASHGGHRGHGGQGGGHGAGQGGRRALPNLIHAHRDELRQAASGSLDHMVIDVISSLFDQILSDPKVPPQMARLIARLQLPVLRAALGDPSFFSSRRHPVRRLVNRMASLGAAFENFDEGVAARVLNKVKALVQEVVEGEFDQIETYEHKLRALEAFIAEQGRDEVQAEGGDATELLQSKEDELRLRALYAQQLQGELKGLSGPAFVREFISNVWSQVLLQAAQRSGPDDERVRRLRQVGRELFMSVQAKTSSAQRKVFLAELPKLMRDLGEGMDLIDWPDAARRAFFGLLLPAHAEALKAQPTRQLDFNLLARQVEGALEKPLPSRADLRSAPAQMPVLTEEIAAPRFSADEARRVGLVDEASVDWNGKVDIDLSAEAPVSAEDTRIEGLPAPTEPVEPTQGKSLADHVQIGFAYQMHLEGHWQKVRLVHVSPARSFFVFNRGSRHKQTISLTQRMLVRLCETGRMRAYEQAYLLERATARARRQLASVNATP
jgi:hypothetical protein